VAANVAVVDPEATVTDAGTVKSPLLLLSDTEAPPAPADLEMVTVQVELAPDIRLLGLQESWLTTGGAESAITAPCELPFSEAVTVADWSDGMAPAVAVKVALEKPAATSTLAGTVSNALLLLSDTDEPPVAGGFDRVMVQVDPAPEARVEGLQDTELTTGATSEMFAVWEPFSVAVTTAVWSVAIVPAVAANEADVVFAATVTEAATVSPLLLLESATAAPPAGAA